MRDLLSWSLPLGRLFGVTVKVHILFPFVVLGLIGKAVFHDAAVPGIWIDATMVMGLLFFSVLLHEFGHVGGARLVDGECHDVLLWPLGGLASVEVPHTWGANLVTTVAGPLVNLALCLACGLGFLAATHCEYQPPFKPFWHPFYVDLHGAVELTTWDGSAREFVSQPAAVILARAFWVNWVLFLLNVLLPGFPLDGGRMLQCALWPRYGYRQATLYAIYTGFGVMLLIGAFAVVKNEVLTLLLAWFIYQTCKNQWLLLETGGEESMLGYDFSQGYTSLERDQPPPPRRREPNFFQKWLKNRAARRIKREQEQREAEERRMDELLEKVQRAGLHALTDEERRFLKRVSDRYRNRQ